MSQQHNAHRSWASLNGPAILVTALVVLALMALTACAASPGPRVDFPDPYRVDLTTYTLCYGEDGAHYGPNGEAQTYPCVWDVARQASQGSYQGYAYVLYVWSVCPVATELVQDASTVRCITVRDWFTD